MRSVLLVFILLFFVAGCSNDMEEESSVVIEWVHFVQWDGEEYAALYDEVITDESVAGEELGEVSFTLDKEVTDSHYEVEDGDAAYLEVGTKLYELPGVEDVLLAESPSGVRPYQLFAKEDYEEMTVMEATEAAASIEVWENVDGEEKNLFSLDDVSGLMDELFTAEEVDEKDIGSEDERYFTFVLKTEDTLSYAVTAQYSEGRWYAYVKDGWVEADLAEWLAELDD